METILKVEGMTCGHCEKSVKDSVNKLEGINKVTVDLDTGNVNVEHDETLVTIDAISEAIENQGYDVVA